MNKMHSGLIDHSNWYLLQHADKMRDDPLSYPAGKWREAVVFGLFETAALMVAK